ncbi:Retrovirus-related Pol polyprotein from transposon RE1 [Vitis vinifera]|uniref:Retrovirus-related Pol polyprotein from transposon RE1 n=1 Tax=Vitis vinifera TaxID=29760 RepID=A0A438I4W0_VITVI|nr:Retrovirus-related Pol polyprotein from transposon RE1 [Vitis vinifera]
MHSEFEMSMMGELNFFLGLQIKQLKEGTFINQAKYIKDLLKRFNMEEAKVMKTPMSSSIKLDMDEKGKSIDSTMYRGMIGSLLYLTASRPDIMYSGDNFELIGFSDADFAGCRVERKSTSGTCHFLGHSLVSWHSKKQNSVALSTAEAEYIAVSGQPVEELVDRFVEAGNLKKPPCVSFFHCSLPFLEDSSSSRLQRPVWAIPWTDFRVVQLHLQASRVSGLWVAFSSLLHSLFGLLLHLFRFIDGTTKRNGHFQGSGQAPSLQAKICSEESRPRRSVNFSQLQHFGFEGLFGRMGWLPVVTISEPVFPTLVRAFYSRVTYGLGRPVLSTVRGVEIRLSPESICHILDIPSVGLRVYKAKAWPTVLGFEPREAVQRLCGLVDPQGMGKPSTHNLTVTSRVLHHMICSILLPRGGHRDEVFYLEAFIVDLILTGRWIHVGYLMMMHMISYVESSTRVLPYGRFLTRAFKDAEVDLSRETDFEAPTTYDTYDEQSLGHMKFEKAPDGSWVRKAELQARGHDQMHPRSRGGGRDQRDGGWVDPQRDFEQRGPEVDIPPPHQSEGIHVEATFSEPMMTKSSFTAGPSSQPSFTELPSQAPHVPDHAPWMDLSAQISSLGTRMEELALVHDSHFYSIEKHLDQYQAGFTSQFEHLVQRIERFESR